MTGPCNDEPAIRFSSTPQSRRSIPMMALDDGCRVGRWSGAACVLAVLLMSPARAEDVRLVLDPESTEISFELGATLHTVHGSARLERGELLLDLERRTATGEVIVDATSAETGNAKRDRKMHRRVLLSEEHPRIVLRPRSWEGEVDFEQESRVTVHGGLTLLGEEHDLDLPVAVRPVDGGLVLELTFEVPYVEWGLEDPSAFLLRVEKSVSVEVRARAGVKAPGLE